MNNAADKNWHLDDGWKSHKKQTLKGSPFFFDIALSQHQSSVTLTLDVTEGKHMDLILGVLK